MCAVCDFDNQKGRFESFFTQDTKLHSFSFNVYQFAELPKSIQELIKKSEIGDYTFYYKYEDEYVLSFCQSYLFMSSDFSRANVFISDDNYRSDYVLSYLLMQAYMFRLIVNNSMMIHSAVAVYDSCGILFCGASGAGKSTQANLWKKYLGASILNYDKPCVLFDNGRYIIHGSPWSGKEALYRNEFVPIKAIVFVIQSKDIKVERVSVAEAFGYLFLNNYVYPIDEEIVDKYNQVINDISQNIPVYNLFCDMSKDSVSALYYKLFDKKPYFENRERDNMKYKVKTSFQMIKVADEYIVIPHGSNAVNYNAAMVFNETGAYLWEILQTYSEIEELSVKFAEKFSITNEEAFHDIDMFIKKMLEHDLLDYVDN